MNRMEKLLADVDEDVNELTKAQARLKSLEHYKVREGLGGTLGIQVAELLHDEAESAARRLVHALKDYHRERTS